MRNVAKFCVTLNWLSGAVSFTTFELFTNASEYFISSKGREGIGNVRLFGYALDGSSYLIREFYRGRERQCLS
jgi:hypothetical protein